MPVKISRHEQGASSEVAWLCDNDWRLPSLVSAFDAWLDQNAPNLAKGNYSVDIGFAPRPDAAGGGAAITLEMMQRMIALGMTLYFSEYPAMINDSAEGTSKA